MSKFECPQAEKHTPEPRGYMEWHEWARMMTAQRSRQVQCSGCGLFAIWMGMHPPISPDAVPQLCLTLRKGRTVTGRMS